MVTTLKPLSSAAVSGPLFRADRPKILIIDADPSSRNVLAVALPLEGFEVVMAEDGITGLERLVEHRPDLVLLDVQLPDQSGLSVFRQAQRLVTAPVPFIVITARNDEVDVIVSLESGASDHVTKPLRMRELVARMRAVLRRHETESPRPVPPYGGTTPGPTHGNLSHFGVASPAGARHAEEVLRAGGLTLDTARHEVIVDQEVVTLSRKEFDLLALLLSNFGAVVTRDQCMDRLWWKRDLADTRTLDTHIRRLRQKIETDATHPRRIVTVRGIGYRFDP